MSLTFISVRSVWLVLEVRIYVCLVPSTSVGLGSFFLLRLSGNMDIDCYVVASLI